MKPVALTLQHGTVPDVPQIGCKVRVVAERSFDAFQVGDIGKVVCIYADSCNCDVLFDGLNNSVRVAFRHLSVISSDVEHSCDSDCGVAYSRSDGLENAPDEDSATASRADPCVLADILQAGRSNISEDNFGKLDSADVSGAIALLGPLETIYDGLSKWKGCALAMDGCLYCAPYCASTVLVIDPHEQVLSNIEGLSTDEAKWSGIAAGLDGMLYCAPCNATSVLVIDPRTKNIDYIDGAGGGQYKWSGITAASNGLLFCAPSRSSTVLIIDPRTRTLSHITGAGGGSSKWSGICEGSDRCLYCAPSMATAVLKVDPNAKTLSRLEGAFDGASFKYKWSGVARSPAGLLYCSPYNASSVLVIDPSTESLSYIAGAGSGDCKWSGIAPGLDGRLYCVPSRAPMIMVIDPGVETLDFDFKVIGRGNSKWSGLCVGLDRWLYCVPYNSSEVLAIKGGTTVTALAPETCLSLPHLVDLKNPFASDQQALALEFQQLLALPSKQRLTRYRELCRRWHPDKNPLELEKSTVLFQFLQQLHERMGALR